MELATKYIESLFKFIISAPGSSSLNIPVQNGKEKPSSFTAKSLVDVFDGLIQEMSELFAKFLCSYSTRVTLHDQRSDVKQKVSRISVTFNVLAKSEKIILLMFYIIILIDRTDNNFVFSS